jgi:hypothetical protein
MRIALYGLVLWYAIPHHVKCKLYHAMTQYTNIITLSAVQLTFALIALCLKRAFATGREMLETR